MVWHAVNQPRLLVNPLLHSLLPLAQRRGVLPPQLVRKTSLAKQTLPASNLRVSPLDWWQLLQNAQHALPNSELWQLLSEDLIQQSYSPLVTAVTNAPTWGQALYWLKRYQSLLLPLEFALTERHGDYLKLTLLPRLGERLLPRLGGLAAPQLLAVGVLINLARAHQVAVAEWHMSWPLAAEVALPSAWHKWLGSIHAGPLLTLHLPWQQLSQAQPRVAELQPALAQALSFCQLQHQHARYQSLLEQVLRWLLVRISQQQVVSIELLAQHCNLSVSSLKRALAHHGSHYQSCVDSIRQLRLLQLLQQHPYNNTELAQLLGYANPNNFRRACKRWLGVCPDHIRANLQPLFT
ncbi:helix-turn-helix domain-containing protein [Pseudidiomarina sp. PP-1MA]|uniref:Helix-turn-helix domain-containing protein n=1 Tax=Pseudidiomarina sp. PP-1MA TaxID=3237706 RepID=A0AB39X8Y4_9GAMM